MHALQTLHVAARTLRVAAKPCMRQPKPCMQWLKPLRAAARTRTKCWLWSVSLAY